VFFYLLSPSRPSAIKFYLGAESAPRLPNLVSLSPLSHALAAEAQGYRPSGSSCPIIIGRYEPVSESVLFRMTGRAAIIIIYYSVADLYIVLYDSIISNPATGHSREGFCFIGEALVAIGKTEI
jgi:hypothetical protein